MTDPNLKNTGVALDRTPGFRFASKKREITRKIIVRDRTRLPLIFLSAAIAVPLIALGLYIFEKSRLAAANREWLTDQKVRQERFVTILENSPSPTPQKTIVQAPTPLPTQQPAVDVPSKAKPTVRAVGAEVNGKPVTR